MKEIPSKNYREFVRISKNYQELAQVLNKHPSDNQIRA